MDEKQYISTLKVEIRHYRSRCLNHLRQVYGIEGSVSPEVLRSLSWTFSQSYGIVPRDLLDVDWPQPIASSYADIYHQTHFIKAVLCSLYCQGLPISTIEVQAAPLCDLAITELQRYEAQSIMYRKLFELLPKKTREDSKNEKELKHEHKPKWKQEVLELLHEIHHMVTRLSQPKNANNKTKKVGSGGDKGS